VLTAPTAISRGDVERLIKEAWGVSVVSLEYLPVGFGSHHWLAADEQGVRHFVTVDELSADSSTGNEISKLGFLLRRALEAASDLREFGCDFVVAPIPTMADSLFVQFNSYVIALYPFIEGQVFSLEESLGEVQRDQILRLVVVLHTVPVTAIRAPAADDFVVPWLDELDCSVRQGKQGGSIGPYAAIASQLLIDNEAGIRRLRARYRALVAQYLSDPGRVVVTHGEIHPGNVMLTSKGWTIVDWDTILVAPPERDLWRLARGGVSELRAYAEATGTSPDQRLIDLYRSRWDVAEIASFAAVFRKPHEDTEDSRRALEVLQSTVGRLRT
jgi:hypothetical protein